jgi:hypothetical protein
MELALKVATKIRDSQRFAVYVVIPMWPEGIPATAALQEILFFQVFFIRSQSFYPFPILTAVVSMICIFMSDANNEDDVWCDSSGIARCWSAWKTPPSGLLELLLSWQS